MHVWITRADAFRCILSVLHEPDWRDTDFCWAWRDTMSSIKLKLKQSLYFLLRSSLHPSSLANKQHTLLHAWGTRNCVPLLVRRIAGEMDVSVSRRRLISVRCSVYLGLFRGLLASKPHAAHFFKSQIHLGKAGLSSFCLVVFQRFTWPFSLDWYFWDVGPHVNLQFSTQRVNK